ncbi:hypothetical protein ACIQF5_20225 [Streptomyces goshikiensis]|uniref:hypothetical protein n=1 Tax=Streptomyces goshikiensis TaxID=1942 RepID=UPI003806BD7D
MSDTLTPELVELGKFFTVSAARFKDGHSVVEMFSGAIDAEWHRLMETPGYAAFSTTHAGTVFGHGANCGTGPVAWVCAYEEMYGRLPAIWFTREDGTLDEDGLTHYRETGIVFGEWNCNPTGGDGDDAAPAPRKHATT